MFKILGVLFFVITAGTACAEQTMVFKEGEHYTRLSSSVANKGPIADLRKKSPKKVQIVEFFSYGCGACFILEPTFETWLKTLPSSSKVDVMRIPVVFHPTWEPLARAYFVLEGANLVQKGHPALFEAVQVQHLDLTDPNALQQFLLPIGVSQAQFNNTYRSFSVDTKMKTARDLAKAYQITAIPMLMVNGPQGVFIPSQKLYTKELLQLLQFLVKEQVQQLNKQG